MKKVNVENSQTETTDVNHDHMSIDDDGDHWEILILTHSIILFSFKVQGIPWCPN
jgi:hypothetical protein